MYMQKLARELLVGKVATFLATSQNVPLLNILLHSFYHTAYSRRGCECAYAPYPLCHTTPTWYEL